MATRHQVRQAVITFLYAHEMGTYSEDFASEYFAEQKIKNDQKNFANELFSGILGNINNIDEKINSYLSSFKLAELGAMERAILRLGAHEILAQTCEPRVAISEAVALASEFGSQSGVKLVNGVLDNISKDKAPQIISQDEKKTQDFYENLNAIEQSLKPKELENSRAVKENKSEKKEPKETRNSRIPRTQKSFKSSTKNFGAKKTEKTEFKKATKAKPASKTAPKRTKKDEK